MPAFHRDGIGFHYIDLGDGIPLVIQHGLGGDTSQPALLFQPPEGFRLISFDARGHGETRPLGPPERIGIAHSADDLLALLDHLGVDRAIVGGISMGAAIALNFALRYPRRLLGLILSRPAWLDRPNPPHLAIFPLMAELIRERGAAEGHKLFLQTPEYQRLRGLNADCAQSLAGHFHHPRAEETAIKFDRIARDTPCLGRAGWGEIRVPTLVMANRQDPIHPFEYGEELARGIPGADFREVTPKSVSFIGHGLDIRAASEDYLLQHFSIAARP